MPSPFEIECIETPLTPEVMASRLRGTGSLLFLDTQQSRSDREPLSIIGRYPWRTVSQKNGITTVDGVVYTESLWDAMRSLLTGDPPLSAELPGPDHLFGYLGYDLACGEMAVPLPPAQDQDPDLPDALFFQFDELVVHNHRTRKTTLIAGGHHRPAADSLREMRQCLTAPLQSHERPWVTEDLLSEDSHASLDLTSNFSAESYCRQVERIRQYIGDGDVYIVNMTRQLRAQTRRDPWDSYRRLRALSPVPFGACLQVDGSDVPGSGSGFSILSASMESFLHIRDGAVETQPIKGTRPRGRTSEQDAILRQELLDSEKDRAELLMIVDLERNDLSRVCRPDSVEVRDLYRLEAYAAVFHLDATVCGRLAPDKDAIDALQILFPGGSITGAPKKRAMEIISEMEGMRRNIYTGCLGWVGPDQNADFSIIIRTVVRQNDRLWYSTGGGITWDSDPTEEYRETQDKARFLERIG